MSIFSLLAEGFESALLACSLILLIPGAAVGLTAREAAIPAIASFATGALALSWLRFSERGGGYSNLSIAAALMLATILLLIPFISRVDLAAVPAGFLAGAAAGELWRPCVGSEFGQLLNELPERGISGLGLMAVYLVGTLSPLLVLGAAHHLLPDSLLEKLEPAWAVLGGVILALLAFTTAVGLHDELVAKLFEWSLDNV
jgi:cytochrome c biogenesis protein CcdA